MGLINNLKYIALLTIGFILGYGLLDWKWAFNLVPLAFVLVGFIIIKKIMEKD